MAKSPTPSNRIAISLFMAFSFRQRRAQNNSKKCNPCARAKGSGAGGQQRNRLIPARELPPSSVSLCWEDYRMNTMPSTETLNGLLRSELSAIETYQEALPALADQTAAAELRGIHADHRENAFTLRKYINEFGGKPVDNSGAWGAFAKTVAGMAGLFGGSIALQALKEGEKRSLQSYERALTGDHLPNECVMLIRETLVPQTRAHIAALDRVTRSKAASWRA